MSDKTDKIDQLLERLNTLLKRQNEFSAEIDALKNDILYLKRDTSEVDEINIESLETERNVSQNIKTSSIEKQAEEIQPKPPSAQNELPTVIKNKATHKKESSSLERFIGENLINKIGIVIILIGVAIGTKYSIENNLMDPKTRLFFGYLAGFGLLVVGLKLKKKYENYSAVLVSGAMAIVYFLTYFSHAFYGLTSQGLAFSLMILFTVLTVGTSFLYNSQVIALIGLVGAYAVPFLLSEGSGNIVVFFTYMTIINAGILFIAYKKYWKILYYTSFGFTWLIFYVWYINYNGGVSFGTILLFLTLFYLIFYLTFLAYKLIKKEKFGTEDIIFILANAFLYYGFGADLITTSFDWDKYFGLFTLINAVIHFAFSGVVYLQKLADKNLFYLLSGIGFVFIGITIPAQLDGNWVTLLWAGEAGVLFWIGRNKSINFYERLSYILIVFSFVSVFHDWKAGYSNFFPLNSSTKMTPIFNLSFLISILYVSVFSFINYVNYHNKPSDKIKKSSGYALFSILIPSILIFSFFNAFLMEISTFWTQLYIENSLKSSSGTLSEFDFNFSIFNTLKILWIIIYSIIFVTVLSFINTYKVKSSSLGLVSVLLKTVTIVLFLILGLLLLSVLRENYYDNSKFTYYNSAVFQLSIRYISFACLGLLFLSFYKLIQYKITTKNYVVLYNCLLHSALVFVLSSELINIMRVFGATSNYKLELSILWGVYALFLVILGIWKQKKHLRIGAICLFGLTFLKLFVYDMTHLDNLSKTIVFVSLGVLLLIVSFLYNKHKHKIINDKEDETIR